MLLEVGRVAKAHGIRGEVLVELVTERVERVAPGSRLTTRGGRELEVVGSTPHQHRWIVAFAGIADRTAAEELHGVSLYAEPIDDPETLWVHDLIGCTVEDQARRPLGQVTAVEANPASDLLVLDGGTLIPVRFVTERVPGLVTVDVPEGLLEL
ncbi:MAG: ribosome maturation factor RimM [Actinomycetota bacterium]|nr:ribosome maturation factor RimM [Actinomycetota bacterium]